MRLMHSTRNWRDYTDPLQHPSLFPNLWLFYDIEWGVRMKLYEKLHPTCPICGEDVSGIVGDPDHVWCFECKLKFEMILGDEWE